MGKTSGSKDDVVLEDACDFYLQPLTEPVKKRTFAEILKLFDNVTPEQFCDFLAAHGLIRCYFVLPQYVTYKN